VNNTAAVRISSATQGATYHAIDSNMALQLWAETRQVGYSAVRVATDKAHVQVAFGAIFGTVQDTTERIAPCACLKSTST